MIGEWRNTGNRFFINATGLFFPVVHIATILMKFGSDYGAESSG
jgi:hypothetical protein